jgi:hypothetical protein
MPCFSEIWRESVLAIAFKRPIGRVRPGNDTRQMADDLPMRKDLLNAVCIGYFERPQDQSSGLQLRDCCHLDQNTHRRATISTVPP